MFALNLGGKKIPPPSFSDLLFEVRVGLGWGGRRGWQWWKPRDQAVPGSGTWKIFLFTTWWEGSDQPCDSPITSPLVPPADHSVSTQRGPVYGEAWEVWGGEILPTDCLEEPDGQMSWSEVRPFLFSAESHRSANGKPYSIRKNWVRPGLSGGRSKKNWEGRRSDGGWSCLPYHCLSHSWRRSIKQTDCGGGDCCFNSSNWLILGCVDRYVNLCLYTHTHTHTHTHRGTYMYIH